MGARRLPVVPAVKQRVGNTQRVVIAGAESTGKTTIAEQLACHYNTAWAPEYLRHFVEDAGRLPAEQDVHAIAAGHLAQQERLLSVSRQVLFLDTDLVLTCLYQRYYFGNCPVWLERQSVQQAGELYLVTLPDFPWVDDPGQRDGPAVRAAIHTQLVDLMRRECFRYVLVGGPAPDRLMKAIRHVDGLLKGN